MNNLNELRHDLECIETALTALDEVIYPNGLIEETIEKLKRKQWRMKREIGSLETYLLETQRAQLQVLV